MSTESYLLEGGVNWAYAAQLAFALIAFCAVLCGAVIVYDILTESDDD